MYPTIALRPRKILGRAHPLAAGDVPITLVILIGWLSAAHWTAEQIGALLIILMSAARPGHGS